MFLLLIPIICHNTQKCMPFYVYNGELILSKNYAIQMLTIYSHEFLQPRLEVVNWASYLVEGYCRDFMFSRNFQFMTCIWSIEVTPKEIIAYTKVTRPKMSWKITTLRNDMPRKYCSHNFCRVSGGPVLLNPQVVLINSTSVNFW